MSRRLLIDGDIMAFRAAASCLVSKKSIKEGRDQPLGVGIAISRLRSMMKTMKEVLMPDEILIWVSGPDNFRYDLYPNYKANRTAAKPPHLVAMQELLVVEYGAKVTQGYETDDAIAMEYGQEGDICCSNDKDFPANLVGWHYDFTLKDDKENYRKSWYVDKKEQEERFATQMLLGDKVDNIVGVFGFGAKVTARKYLEQHQEGTLFMRVGKAYAEKFGIDATRMFTLNFRLLNLLKSEQQWEDMQKHIKGLKHEDTDSQSEGQGLTEESSEPDSSDVARFTPR